jgi:hypothetical protein
MPRKPSQLNFLGVAKCGTRIGVVNSPSPGSNPTGTKKVESRMNGPAISMYDADQKHTGGATSSASASSKASTNPQIKRRDDAEAEESRQASVVTTLSPRGGTDFAPLSPVRAAARQNVSADIQSQIEEVFQSTIGDGTSSSRPRDDGGLLQERDVDMAGDDVREFFEQGGFGSGRVVEVSVHSQGANWQETKTWVAAPCECEGVCVSMCRLNVKVKCECVT